MKEGSMAMLTGHRTVNSKNGSMRRIDEGTKHFYDTSAFRSVDCLLEFDQIFRIRIWSFEHTEKKQLNAYYTATRKM